MNTSSQLAHSQPYKNNIQLPFALFLHLSIFITTELLIKSQDWSNLPTHGKQKLL